LWPGLYSEERRSRLLLRSVLAGAAHLTLRRDRQGRFPDRAGRRAPPRTERARALPRGLEEASARAGLPCPSARQVV